MLITLYLKYLILIFDILNLKYFLLSQFYKIILNLLNNFYNY